MRILHAETTLASSFGGTAKAVADMTAALAQRGHDVTLCVTDYGGETVPLDQVRAAGVDVRIFPTQPPKAWHRSRPMALALKQIVPTVDVVHLHSIYDHHCWVTGRLCRAAAVPYVVRPHGGLDPYFRRRYRLQKVVLDALFQNRVLRNAAAVHYTAELERRRSEDRAFGTRGVVIPLGLHLSNYRPLPPRGAFRGRYPEIADRRIILFLGRLAYKKGLDVLIPAFAQASRRQADLHLVLAGPDENMTDKVRGWAADHDVIDRITFTGMLTGVDKLAALVDAEIFVLPSYADNFGIAVVEAMACGLPVLISDNVGVWPEVLKDGVGAVAACDAAAFGKALAEMLEDRDGIARMRAAGPAAVARRYDWKSVVRQLEDLYASVISSSDGRR